VIHYLNKNHELIRLSNTNNLIFILKLVNPRFLFLIENRLGVWNLSNFYNAVFFQFLWHITLWSQWPKRPTPFRPSLHPLQILSFLFPFSWYKTSPSPQLPLPSPKSPSSAKLTLAQGLSSWVKKNLSASTEWYLWATFSQSSCHLLNFLLVAYCCRWQNKM
jgi:hypothetical protein